MKLINIILVIIVVAVSTALAVYLAGCNQRTIRNVTVSLLQQIPRSCLVLETAEELTVATIDGGGWLLGPRSGMAVATKRTHWALNLERISSEDIVVSAREVSIKLPDPEVFDSVVDMSTFRCLTRRSGFYAIIDGLFSDRSLFAELAALASRTPPEPSPEQIQTRRAEFVRRLNEQAAGLFQAKDLVVRFE